MSKSKPYTVDETMVEFNDKLVSNWSKLASFIQAWENVRWETAKEKALDLIKDEAKALAYINDAKAKYKAGQTSVQEQQVSPPSVPAATEEQKPKSVPKELPRPKLSIYEKNYIRLLKILPGLEEELAKNTELAGRSKSPPYMDLHVDLVHRNSKGYYLSLAHYYTQNGDLVPDPDMVVRVDTKRGIVEALSFQNAMFYGEVYDDIYNPKMVNKKEKKGQNDFLTDWLKNLIRQGHKVEWDKDEQEPAPPPKNERKNSIKKAEEKKDKEKEPADSELVIQYDKPQEQENKPEAKKEEKAPEVETKKENDMEDKKPVTVKFQKELINMIVDHEEKQTLETAEKKAQELVESGKVADYAIAAFTKMQGVKMVDLFDMNYKLLRHLIPDLFFDQDEEKHVNLFPVESEKMPMYKVESAAKIDNLTKQFVIREYHPLRKKNGCVMVAIKSRVKMVWVELFADGFNELPNFSNETIDHPMSEKRFEANKDFQNWLLSMILGGYEAGNTIIDGEPVRPTPQSRGHDAKPAEGTTQAATDPSGEKQFSRKEVIDKMKENALEIPDFLPGEVKLCEAHKKAGVTQKIINWINKNKKGLTIRPKKKMNYNTRSESIDKLIKAQPPGFRISATGKLYYEFRSNRADVGNNGL